MTSEPGLSATGPRALLQQWESVSLESVWLRPGDWYTPATEAVVEALDARLDTGPGAFQLGQARAAAGVGITETIDDLVVLFTAANYESAPIRSIRALCEGWTTGTTPTLDAPTTTDPESGVGTSEYLAHRLGELYGSAERAGVAVPDTHALVMVDVSTDKTDPWQRIARNAAVGSALRGSYGEGHPIARVGDGLYAVLVERGPGVGDGIAALRHYISGHAAALRTGNLLRQPPRVWIETLPATHPLAVQLVESLQRFG